MAGRIHSKEEIPMKKALAKGAFVVGLALAAVPFTSGTAKAQSCSDEYYACLDSCVAQACEGSSDPNCYSDNYYEYSISQCSYCWNYCS